MTAVAARSRGFLGLSIAGVIIMALLVVLLALGDDSDDTLLPPLDPGNFEADGYAGLRIFLEESGASVRERVAVPGPEDQAAILSHAGFAPGSTIGGVSELDELLDWVRDGGTLLTTAPVVGASDLHQSGLRTQPTVVERGVCDIEGFESLQELSSFEGALVGSFGEDQSCFGDGRRAGVVMRPIGEGRIFSLPNPFMISNEYLDERDNAALLGIALSLNDAPQVAFLSVGALRGTDTVDGSEAVTDEEQGPAGDSGLIDLVPTRVWAFLAVLLAALAAFALARGRRFGSPITEPQPIELPSSSYTEAVGRRYRGIDDPVGNATELLRLDFRNLVARRVGLPADAPTEKLIELLTPDVSRRQRMRHLLDGPPPQTEEDLVEFVTNLNEEAHHLSGSKRMTRDPNPLADPDATEPERSMT